MHLLNLLSLALCTASSATAMKVFVGSGGGQITTLEISDTDGTVKELSSVLNSAPSPNWQEISHDGKILYTTEESTVSNSSLGAITSYGIDATGALTKITSSSAPAGPVSISVSPNGTTIFSASYTAGGASAYTTNPRGDIRHLNDWTYTLEKPGPVEDRQTASHPHQALFDPTGRFVLIPDLGADKIRVYGVSSPGTDITQRADIPVTAGTGPRHGVFFPSTGTPRFYYLINELSSTITVFAVSYTASDIVLREIEARTTAPAPLAKGKTSFPSEAVISSCGRFLYAANRWDGYFGEKVDSMVMFARDSETGKLGSPEFFSGGVLNIRHFSIDPAGKWLVTEGQTSEDIRVFRRDGDTGKVQPVGEPFKVKGGPLCLTWGKK